MRLIIVSNRTPVNIVKNNGSYHYEESSGGLASGLRAFIARKKNEVENPIEIIWIGWPGADVDDREKVGNEIKQQFGVECVFLSSDVMEKFYEGFCNKTIWPLFHYFTTYTIYDKIFWEQYIFVNTVFCKAVLDILQPGDIVWVHDYHLMLLPGMIRDKVPNATIGFFLHIPFPSYEVFRLLPSVWRRKIMEGLYGADLIGFHTHDYRTYFIRCTLRILGLDDNMGEVLYNNRLVKVDSFPMGIDYEKYHNAVQDEKLLEEKNKLQQNLGSFKLILSIDRQDYTKGILNRLAGYELFLETHEHWRKKVVMVMVVIPSRSGVGQYQITKSQIDELVGRINGKYGNLEWTPIVYQYRSLAFEELIALYNLSNVALVTPLRDGMNLVAKEYIASKTDKHGVLILSEMVGAADELSESIIINPNNIDEISDALYEALEMQEDEQATRLETMQNRLINYDVFKWADSFITSLNTIKNKQGRLKTRMMNFFSKLRLIVNYKIAKQKLLFLDYDGTLIPFAQKHFDAKPGKDVINTLRKLSSGNNVRVVLISGRDKQTLEDWFGQLPIEMVAEHGIMIKEKGKDWQLLKPVRNEWKAEIIPIMNHYVEKLPGSYIEEKNYSVAFHYRMTDKHTAEHRVKELMEQLVNFTSNLDLQVLQGNMVIEIRNAGVDKGIAAMHWLEQNQTDFILSIGDDWTDEDLFKVMPDSAYSIKVGTKPSYARYNVATPAEVINLLSKF